MDAGLQNLRRKFSQDPSHANAMELAGALLRTGSLAHFRDLALAGDAEAIMLLRHMRAQLLTEGLFVEIEDVVRYPRFLNQNLEEDQSKYVTKYVNVFCNKIPFASVTVDLVDDAITTVAMLRNLYSTYTFLPPPDPVEISKSTVSQTLGHEATMTVAVYRPTGCKYTLSIDEYSCFDFADEDALPVIERTGRREIRMRAVNEDDIASDEDGTNYKTISYEDLPDFAKPDVQGTPCYVMASLVTRASVQDIDGPAWHDYFDPVAKVYVGYLVNYLLTNPSGWTWSDVSYSYTCRHTEAEAAAIRNTWLPDGGYDEANIPARIERQLHACPLAGIPQVLASRPRRPRCHECGSDVEVEIADTRILVISEDAPAGTPEVPPYLNQLLDYLQRLYQAEVHGDINSVLGGQDLSVYLSHGNYGPIT